MSHVFVPFFLYLSISQWSLISFMLAPVTYIIYHIHVYDMSDVCFCFYCFLPLLQFPGGGALGSCLLGPSPIGVTRLQGAMYACVHATRRCVRAFLFCFGSAERPGGGERRKRRGFLLSLFFSFLFLCFTGLSFSSSFGMCRLGLVRV